MSGMEQLSMADRNELEDFFGAAWDFAPNSTFADLSETSKPDPVLSGTIRDDASTIGIQSSNASLPKRSPPSSPGKMKPPNLYETLRHAQMMAQAPLMVAMSPMAGLADGSLGGLQWSPPTMVMDSTMGMMQNSPNMMLDPNQQALNMLLMQNRIKRARVSPYLGSSEAVPMMGNFGMNMFGLRPRTVKMPLTPVNGPLGGKIAVKEVEDTSTTMPLVLPFAAGNTRVKPSMAPVAATARTGGGSNLEEAFERNLRSFLEQTKNLSWESVTVQDLKKILRQYELNASGKKAELMRRIKKIRDQYRHLEEAFEGEVKKTLPVERTLREKREEKPESSPESMDSDRDITGGETKMTTNLEFDSLDALFADSLNGTAGNPEFLFS